MVTMQDAIALARETKDALLATEQQLQDLNITLEDLGLGELLASARDFLHKAGH